MGLMEGFKNMLKNWLEIQPSQHGTIVIKESLDFNTNVAKNRIWHRGDPYELEQLYKNLKSELGKASFWASVPVNPIHKIHTGLPALIIDTLVSIVSRDMNSIEFKDNAQESVWSEIAKENNFKEIIEDALSDVLVCGDGAFKISFDSALSQLPIIEFWPADEIEFIYQRKRLKEIVFKSIHKSYNDQQNFRLYEYYGHGYIKYKLMKVSGSQEVEIPLSMCPDTENLMDVIFGNATESTPGDFMMAVPFVITHSKKFSGRGKSILDQKSSTFDALDEVVSQWMDAVRKGRVKTYIPDTLIPKDQNGKDILPSAFESNFVKTAFDRSEGASNNKIDTDQPTIPSDNYLQSYITLLDLCLQGIISPSTLGIDTKKLDNAEAQREKEKTTLYTRNKIIERLTETVTKLIQVTLAAKSVMDKQYNRKLLDTEVSVTFGEYANPSFEAVVETVTKAKQGGVMSIRTALDEMYADSKEEDWKEEEAKRIAEESGAVGLPEPNVPTDIGSRMSFS